MSNGSHAGRPKSWVAVSIIFIGFVIGGVAVTLGPNWVMFGIGAAVIAIGGIIALAVDIMADVVVDEPRAVALFGRPPLSRSASPHASGSARRSSRARSFPTPRPRWCSSSASRSS